MNETFLSELVALWEKIIERARARKWEHFGKTADRAWAFVGKDYNDLYVDARDERGEQFPHVERGVWQTRRNLCRDYIATMMPYIHTKIPNRLVLPRRPGIPPELLNIAAQNPQMQEAVAYANAIQKALEPTDAMRAFLLKWFLNYLPAEYDLFGEQRKALPEALVKGRCVSWTELAPSANGLIPVTYYDSIDGLLVDPDCRIWREAGFIIRERCEHVIRTAEKFSTAAHRIDPSELRGKFDSQLKTAAQGANLVPRGSRENSDVCVYYEVYSRFGTGHRLYDAGDEMKKLSDALDQIGNCYLAIMPGLPHPLNLWPESIRPESAESTEELRARLSWPIPFHVDLTDPWPCSPCDFMPNQNDPWATSPLEGCLPLLAFIDHAYSYLMSRVRSGCRNVFIGSKALGDEFVTRYLEAVDLEYIQYDGKPGEDLDKLLHRVEYPDIKRDVLMIIEKIESAFEQASGMTAALQGDSPTKQDRSATATSAREARLSSRPNDFADCVEAWNSRIAAKESLATRLYVGKDVMMPFFGEQDVQVPDPNVDPQILEMAQQTGQEVPTITVSGPLTQQWMELVSVGSDEMTQDKLEQAAREAATELTFTVEAGSGRRKNRQKQIEDFGQLSQQWAAFWSQLAVAGNPGPYNWAMGLAADVYDRSMEGAMIQAMPQEQGQGEADAAAQEAESAKSQQDMQLTAAEHDQDSQIQQEKQSLDASSAQQKMEMEESRHEQEMRHKEESHQLEMRLKEATAKAQAQAAKSNRQPQGKPRK